MWRFWCRFLEAKEFWEIVEFNEVSKQRQFTRDYILNVEQLCVESMKSEV